MMDAFKYLKTLRRMCNGECRECEYEKKVDLTLARSGNTTTRRRPLPLRSSGLLSTPLKPGRACSLSSIRRRS